MLNIRHNGTSIFNLKCSNYFTQLILGSVYVKTIYNLTILRY
jgi:hypothetical protein